MNAVTFTAKIGEDGSPEFDEPKRFAQFLKGLAGKRVRIEVRQFRAGRTLSQNAHLWAGVYGEIMAQLFHDREDISAEDVHQWCREKWCPTMEVPWLDGGVLKRRSTRLLNVEQMSEYTEKVMAHFASEYGVEFGR